MNNLVHFPGEEILPPMRLRFYCLNLTLGLVLNPTAVLAQIASTNSDFLAARQLYDKQRYDKAFAGAQLCIQRNPKLADAYVLRAKCLYQEGEYDKALVDLNMANS